MKLILDIIIMVKDHRDIMGRMAPILIPILHITLLKRDDEYLNMTDDCVKYCVDCFSILFRIGICKIDMEMWDIFKSFCKVRLSKDSEFQITSSICMSSVVEVLQSFIVKDPEKIINASESSTTFA